MIKPCFTPSAALRYSRIAKPYAWGRHVCGAHASASWDLAPAQERERERPRRTRVQHGNRGAGDNRGSRDYRGAREYRERRDYGNQRGRTDSRRRDTRERGSINPETEMIRAAQASGDDLLYGLNPVLQALLSLRRPHYTRLFLQTGGTERATHSRIVRLAKDAEIPMTRLSKHGMNSLCDNRPHQGTILSAGALSVPLMSNLKYEEGVWVALDEVTDPHNVGAIMRSAVFLGAKGVLLCRKNCCGVTAAVAKASAGATEVCDVRGVGSMARFLNRAKEGGWRVLGMDAGGVGVESVKKEGGTIVVVGSEGKGLRSVVREACEEVVGIDGAEETGEVDSLNVSVAAGVALFALVRGNKMRGG